ncbi:DedA family protein [Chroococcidiopsis sp. FACHB-1243]|uniref:DedA family protein n=1 Tax=Chroococcidiopsis sp. [FACHB-1243] TaxID=2692781 RepID=UPI0017876262|nr:DedA family protein [Chroococcidiopsis sp. [FACHB-1243]]MBD2307736.1 DedA family protein [Chroococcidiopsis sp. [FACHB-1243]]
MLNWITNIISSLSYWGIALLMLLENILPPIPSEVIMPLAGFTAQKGQLNLLFVILAGTVGSILGALPWYYIGKQVGERRLRQWVDRHGKWLTLSGEDIDKSQQWFNKYGGAVVFFGRLIPGVRTPISIPAGFEEMPLFAFLLYSTVGTLLWVGLLSYAGFVLGQNYQLVKKFLTPISIVVAVVLALVLGVWIFRRRQKKHSSKK